MSKIRGCAKGASPILFHIGLTRSITCIIELSHLIRMTRDSLNKK